MKARNLSTDAKSSVAPDDASKGEPGFPIVGIGASAGGLAAFEAFFSVMPTDGGPGMAFVLVQHLAPDHNSILSQLVGRYTKMRVFEVEQGMVVAPGCAYIIPPNRDMTLLNGTLRLTEPSAPRGHRLPIDSFFRSLAMDQHERAIGIVLSGTGSDGTQGIRAIKGEGGMVMVQDPDSTEYDGMPRSAIATGLVDYELLPAEMPPQLIAYVSHAFGTTGQVTATAEAKAKGTLKAIFAFLRTQTGHDFSRYKSNTIQRRIERRMAVHQIETVDRYAAFLQKNTGEVGALFREMMIGVTSFFRDPDCFALLSEKVLPDIIKRKSAGDTIRVWCAGCSTGEEAYSIAILLRECLDAANKSCGVQIFATDIDSRAIAVARAGTYPSGIVVDVSPERLAGRFVLQADGESYRVEKSIRDTLVISEQDIIRDPPVSRLDMISCRNVLIYMGGELQRKIIPIFHYALSPSGILFLGTSETVGEHRELFDAVDRKSKIFSRKEHAIQRHHPIRPSNGSRVITSGATPPGESDDAAQALDLGLREVTEQALLRQVASAGALVTSHGDILYLHGRTGLYLEPAPGESGVNNILKMARDGLRHDLTMALHRASSVRAPVVCRGLHVQSNGSSTMIDLTVAALTEGAGAAADVPLFLVVMTPAQPTLAGTSSQSPVEEFAPDENEQVALLQKELQEKEEYLRSAIEELETTNEELKSSNEEMQSVNEELQSTNEELETSKEEMQSINEELATVNAELQANVSDLSRANNDMNNLLSGTGVGTIFVDHQLHILRFTPTVTEIINLIPGDIGRPVGHIVSNLVGYGSLVEDTQSVLDTLVEKEAEVQTTDGRWYTLRIVPYRTIDNVIEGAVVTFFNISEMVAARERIDGLLREKDILLREVHHRVKNNMATIMGLLSLHAGKLDNPAAVAALTDAQNRINAMALLYDKIYRSEGLDAVPLQDYITPLIEETTHSFPEQSQIAIETSIEDIPLDVARLFPIGILLNELLSNIQKYAFVGRTHGLISVSAAMISGRVVMSVADDGIGIPESIDLDNTTGFGLTLVGLLASQLGGEIRIERGAGTRFVLEFDA